MKVALVQMDITWGNIQANCLAAEQLINSNPGSDLYVLPEMFSTGFAIQPEEIADDKLQSLSWMRQTAQRIQAAICGSVATKCPDGTNCNRFYFVKPDGSWQYYDKHHLFTYGKEHLRYQAGKERVVVEWRGARFLLQVCYDLRFPVFSRNSAVDPYDCAIYVASWPKSRIEPWRALLRARAIENQCYVLGVNRVGSDPVCTYCGGTECVDAYGRVVSVCPDDHEGVITLDLDLERLAAFRKKFPVLLDAD